MATKVFLSSTFTQPAAYPQDGYRNMVTALIGSGPSTLIADDTVVNNERQFGLGTTPANAIPMGFWSERVTAQVTISGTITFNIYGLRNATSLGRLRARLYKITAGGSNIETLIATADAAADLTATAAQYVFTATPTSTVVAPGERFILRLWVIPVAGSFGSTGDSHVVQYGSSGLSDSWIQFTETVGFKINGTQLNFRRTTDSGLSTYQDMLEALGVSAALFANGSTEASGTEVPWTKTPANPVSGNNQGVSAASTTDAASYTSAAYTPSANVLYLLAVAHSDAAPESTVPTVSTTTGLNFVQVGSSIPYSTIASPGLRLTLFRAMKSSGLVNGTHTINFADAGTGCVFALSWFSGVVTTGTDGADAVTNISTNNNNASANPSVTLGAFNHARNGTYACFATNLQATATAGSGFAKLDDSGYLTPTQTLIVEWQRLNDTTADLTLASSAWAGIAVELVGDTTTPIPLEFISGRVKAPGFTLTDIANVTARVWVQENNLSANAGARLKVFRRRPDGTELLVATRTSTAELVVGTSTGNNLTGSPTLAQETNFAEDDRVLAKLYITNVGTMAAGYLATLRYDAPTAGTAVDGNSNVNLLDGPEFKAESDPAGTARIPGGLTMGGVGN